MPISDIQHLLTFQFKSLLTQNIALTAKILPNLDEDDRLIRMLSELDKRYTGADYTVDKNSKDTIKPEQIKPLKDNGAFPLCMRYMQTTLEKTHHLKYNSRLQYGLFLKGNTEIRYLYLTRCRPKSFIPKLRHLLVGKRTILAYGLAHTLFRDKTFLFVKIDSGHF